MQQKGLLSDGQPLQEVVWTPTRHFPSLVHLCQEIACNLERLTKFVVILTRKTTIHLAKLWDEFGPITKLGTNRNEENAYG